MKKQSFFLLEIFIAFIIISLCYCVTIKSFFYFYRSNIKILEELESERIADHTFYEIMKNIYEMKAADFNKLSHDKYNPSSFSFNDYILNIEPISSFSIKRTYSIWINNKENKALLYISVHLSHPNWKFPKKYKYNFLKKDSF